MYMYRVYGYDNYEIAIRHKKKKKNVGSTSPVFAPYWPARLAVGCSKAHTASALHPKPVGYMYGFMLYWAKKLKNTQRTGRTHVIIASQEGDSLRTSNRP